MKLSETNFSELDYSFFIKYLSTFLRDAICRPRMTRVIVQGFLKDEIWVKCKQQQGAGGL
jgi:hypothetical protein